MNNKIIKVMFFALTLALFTFFINIENIKAVKAVANGDDKGYAMCYYEWEEHKHEAFTGGDGSVVTSYDIYEKYRLGIAAYRGTDGHYYGWADVGCSGQDGSQTVAGCGTIDNYNSIFNNMDSYSSYFISGNNWKCPNKIYINKDTFNHNLSIHFKESECNFGGCQQSPSAVGSTIEKTGQPGKLKTDGASKGGTTTMTTSTGASTTTTTPGQNGNSDKNGNSDTSKIKEWAKANKSGKTEYAECDNIITKEVRDFLNNLFTIIQVIGIILMVVLTASEFIKIITGSEEDGLRSAFKHTVVRIVVVIILLLLPMFINWILNVVEIQNASGKDATICKL